MRIDLYKLIRSLLVTFMRSNRLAELIRVLTREVETAYNQFNVSVPDWMYKINANASIISLQHHIKRELDVDAVITELDGKPVDFLIEVTGFVDESQLRALIDSYKLSGKSYVFKVGSVVYSCQFSNHVCEIELVDNLLTIHNSFSVPFSSYVTSAFNVTSNVEVIIRAVYTTGEMAFYYVTIPKGTSTSNVTVVKTGSFTTEPQIGGASPHDLNYNYTY